MRPSLLKTTQCKNEAERQLGFRPALQQWRQQRRPDLRWHWKPPSRTLHHAPSQAISRAAALPRMVLFQRRQVLLLDILIPVPADSSPVPPRFAPRCRALDPCLCLSSFVIVQVFPNAAVSLPPVVLQVFLDCGISCVD
jgi:hypothetical protein